MLFAAINSGVAIGFAILVLFPVFFLGMYLLEKANEHDSMMGEDKRFIERRSGVKLLDAERPFDWDLDDPDLMEDVNNIISFDPFYGMRANHPSHPGFTPKDIG